MSRLRKRHVEALRELTDEVDRMDFIEKFHCQVSRTDHHWWSCVHHDTFHAYSTNHVTAREAVDACRDQVRQQIKEMEAEAAWKKRWLPDQKA
jgi:hypothetical protein